MHWLGAKPPLCFLRIFHQNIHLCFAGSTHRDQRNTQVDVLAVALGESLTLNCTYDCSGGFVRGCWSKPSDRSGCYGALSKMDFCTISLQLPNVTAEFLEKNLTCYTQDTDHLELPQNIVRTVLLQLHGEHTYPVQILILHYKHFTNRIKKTMQFFIVFSPNNYPVPIYSYL